MLSAVGFLLTLSSQLTVQLLAAEVPPKPVADPVADIKQIVDSLRSGLFVQAGIKDTEQALRAAGQGSWLVHVIGTDVAATQQARGQFNEQSLTGLISAEFYDSLTTLPYRDNAVSVLYVDADTLGDAAPNDQEILRVLTPKHGVAIVHRGGQWTQLGKPWPEEYGNWTHLYGQPNGNLFSDDVAVDVPTGLGWIGEGGIGQNNSTLVDDGIIIMGDRPIKQTTGNKVVGTASIEVKKRWLNGLPERFKKHASSGLSHIARDAFNGIPRYRLPAKKETPRMIVGDKFLSSVIAPSERTKHPRLQKIYIMAAYDLRSGKKLLEYTEGLSAEYTQSIGGLTYDALKKGKKQGHNLYAAAQGNLLVQTAGNQVVGLDVHTGKRLWTYQSSEKHTYGIAISEDGQGVYFGEGDMLMRRVRFYGARNSKNVVRLDAKTGEVIWKVPVPAVEGRKSPKDRKNIVPLREISQIIPVVQEDKVFICASDHHAWAAERAYVAALHMNDGSLAWLRGANRRGDRRVGVNIPSLKTLHTKEERETYFKKYQKEIQLSAMSDDSDASNMAMLYRNGKIEYYGSYNIWLYDADTGFMSQRSQDNMGCQRSVGTPNMTYIASYAFATTVEHGEVNYEEVGFQHPHCGDGFVPSQGMWFTESSEKCLCARHIWAQFSMISHQPTKELEQSVRLQKAGEFPGENEKVFKSIMPVGKAVAQSPILPAWERGYYGPITARDAIYHDNEGWSEVLTVGPWVYKADLHGHRMVGFKDGQAIWSYQTGGRIPGLAVLHDKTLYFGCRDGYVYAVHSETGQPKWRFLAARNHHKIYVSGQLESLWPATNVVLHEGNIVVAAGLHNQADHGLYVWGLDPATGNISWQSRIFNGPRAHSEGNHYYKHAGAGRMKNSMALYRLDVVGDLVALQFEHKKGFGPQPPDARAHIAINPETDNGQVISLSERNMSGEIPYKSLPWMTDDDLIQLKAGHNGSKTKLTVEELKRALHLGAKIKPMRASSRASESWKTTVQEFNVRLKQAESEVGK